MPRRLTPLVNEYIYHVYNRGVEKSRVFRSSSDYVRFIDTIEHYQFSNPVVKLSKKDLVNLKKPDEKRLIEVIAFCLMPNHFHLMLKQKIEAGISTFVSKFTNSYTRYFNTKYDRIGPLFQGQFKVVLVENDDQLMHLSRYIHLNPYVSELVNDLNDYKWSSYPCYIGQNNLSFVESKEVLGNFVSKQAYERFVLDQSDYGLTLEKIKHSLLE